MKLGPAIGRPIRKGGRKAQTAIVQWVIVYPSEPASNCRYSPGQVYYGRVSRSRRVFALMPGKTRLVFFLAILLAGVFFAAQLHCCVQLHPGALDSHVCPICSTAGTAIATHSLTMALAPAVNRLEAISLMAAPPAVISRLVAPRAPPAV